jgi:hypothetical protein
MGPIPDPLDGGLNDGLCLPIGEILEVCRRRLFGNLKLVAGLASEESSTVRRNISR